MTNGGRWSTGRLDGAITLALSACGIGVLVGNVLIFLSGVIGVIYTAYAFATTLPNGELSIERTLVPDSPLPGDDVEVTLTVRNVGDSTLPDLRIVDDVPDTLGVIDGSPSLYTGLRPGDEETITYTVRAKRGEYVFESATVIARNLSGTRERKEIIGGESRLLCLTEFDQPPLHEQTMQLAGQVQTDTAGSGVEFYATREYRSGDPMKRIDWNTLAKTNELTTVEYREQRAGTVILLVDVRSVAKTAPSPEHLDGRDLCVYAAEQALDVLTEHGNRVGVIFYGSQTDSLPPSVGSAHESRVSTYLAENAEIYQRTVSGVRRDGGYEGFDIRTLQKQLPSTAQVLLFTPAVDDFVIAATRQLQAFGHPVTVLSPDVTVGDSIGQRIESIHRADRLQETRGTGAGVIDWNPSDPLSIAVGHAIEQWL